MNIEKIDLNLLRAFDALISERNVSRAAKRLFLSQPATSALLAKLRDVFKDPLLVRAGRGMIPTDRAIALAGPVRRVLEDVQEILQEEDAFDPRQSTRTFVVATTEYVANIVSPALAERLQATAAGIRIALVPGNADTIVREMEGGTLDLAILNDALIPPQLRSTILFKDEFCVIARRAHPVIKKALSLDAFCALPHLVISPRGGSFSAQTDDVLAALGRKRFVRLSVPYFTLAADLVARSDLIAVYPQQLAKSVTDRVQVFKPPLAVPSVLMRMCWHERVQKNPAHQWLRSTLLDCMK